MSINNLNSMKKTYVTLGVSLLVVVAIILIFVIATNKNEKLASVWVNPGKINLIGSSVDLKPLPTQYLEGVTNSNSMATTTILTNGSESVPITQIISTEGIDYLDLYIKAKGSVSTSTAYIRQQVSYDGSTFLDIPNATTTTQWATSTVEIRPYVLSFVPGTATTSGHVITLPTHNAKYTQLLLYTGTSGELNTGVQAWIDAVLTSGISR
jgi:hypothetical protein